MKSFLSGTSTILAIELRQRVRGIAWYVLIGVFVVLVGLVTLATWIITGGLFAADEQSGSGLYSTIIYFVLLLGTLVAPALSGNALNGERDAGTLATTQVTLVTTWQLILGKFLAAWVTALTFLLASLPFLLFAMAVGGVDPATVVVSTLILAAELGVIAAVGVGLSGLLAKPILSIVVTYLFVAALSIGSLIAFSLLGLATTSEQHTVSRNLDWSGDIDESTGLPEDLSCMPPVEYTNSVPRFDYYWGVLAANPYVVLADAVPTRYDEYGYPVDLFGSIKFGIRQAQIAPDLETEYDECSDPGSYDSGDEYDPAKVIDETLPTWFFGLAVHFLLAGGALVGAWSRVRTPTRSLGKGSRIA